MTLANVTDLHYRFRNAGDEALRGISLHVERGEILGLIGADGAGKSTLLRLMAGLLKPTGGSIEILNENPQERHTAISRRIGYMSQQFSLYSDLTVVENLNLTARLRCIAQDVSAREQAQLLQAAGLSAFTARPAGKLSGGMKQKLALICALQGEPELLLLDEPGVGVDPVSRRELWQTVQKYRCTGKGIIWATAYPDEAAACDRVCILHRGSVLFIGRPKQLLAPLRGRVFSFSTPPQLRLAKLRQLQASPEVQDAMIEGASVRCLLKAPPADIPVGAIPAEPKFEEALVALPGIGQESGTPVSTPSFPDSAKEQDVVIITENLTRRFGSFIATDRLNIRIRRGEIFGILGANGAGKTTAFRMICGLLPPSDGRAEILGIDLRRDPRRARATIGYMAQKFSLYANLSVLRNLRFFASAYGLKGIQKEERIAAGIQRFDLQEYVHHTSGTLPLGIKQRLSMACATLHNPPFLFLDEPTSGVDPFARRQFWEIINEMAAGGVTIVVTTHFMEEAQYMHRMIIMNRGRVIAEGAPEELKARAASAGNPEPTMEEAFIHFIGQEVTS